MKTEAAEALDKLSPIIDTWQGASTFFHSTKTVPRGWVEVQSDKHMEYWIHRTASDSVENHAQWTTWATMDYSKNDIYFTRLLTKKLYERYQQWRAAGGEAKD